MMKSKIKCIYKIIATPHILVLVEPDQSDVTEPQRHYPARSTSGTLQAIALLASTAIITGVGIKQFNADEITPSEFAMISAAVLSGSIYTVQVFPGEFKKQCLEIFRRFRNNPYPSPLTSKKIQCGLLGLTGITQMIAGTVIVNEAEKIGPESIALGSTLLSTGVYMWQCIPQSNEEDTSKISKIRITQMSLLFISFCTQLILSSMKLSEVHSQTPDAENMPKTNFTDDLILLLAMLLNSIIFFGQSIPKSVKSTVTHAIGSCLFSGTENRNSPDIPMITDERDVNKPDVDELVENEFGVLESTV